MTLAKYLHIALSCGLDYRAAMLSEISTVYEICNIRSKEVRRKPWQPGQ